MWFEQLQFDTKRPERAKVSWWKKAGNYVVVWNKQRKQEDEEINSFRDLEKERFVVNFILEDTNLSLMKKTRGKQKKHQIEVESSELVMWQIKYAGKLK